MWRLHPQANVHHKPKLSIQPDRSMNQNPFIGLFRALVRATTPSMAPQSQTSRRNSASGSSANEYKLSRWNARSATCKSSVRPLRTANKGRWICTACSLGPHRQLLGRHETKAGRQVDQSNAALSQITRLAAANATVSMKDMLMMGRQNTSHGTPRGGRNSCETERKRPREWPTRPRDDDDDDEIDDYDV